MSYLEQQSDINIESIKEEAGESKETPLDPNINVKQEPVGDLEDEKLMKELYVTMSHPEPQSYIKIERIKEEVDKSKESPLYPNTNVKQEPVSELKDEINTKEQYATISHPEKQFYITIENIKDEEEACESKEDPLDPNRNVKQEPVDVLKDEIIMKELYVDHEIKEEMVIGPLELQRSDLDQVNRMQNICVVNTYKNDTHTRKKVCESNSLNFETKQHHKVHKMSHTGKTPYKCKICYKYLKTKRIYKLHVMTHNGGTPYKCDICNKCFKRKQYLKDHILRHNGQKNYMCRHCNKSFLTNFEQNRHLRIHTGEKAYKCDICNKCLTTKESLKRHVMAHSGESPYKCDICNKYLTRKQYLKEHIMTHTGQSPYKCDICNKCLTTKQSLKRHAVTHSESHHSSSF